MGNSNVWDDVQRIYYDHPADAIPILERILSEEILEISEKRINEICVFIAYHDLLRDSMAKGRYIEEMENLKLTRRQKYMLAALSIADIASIREEWISGLLEWLVTWNDEVVDEKVLVNQFVLSEYYGLVNYQHFYCEEDIRTYSL